MDGKNQEREKRTGEENKKYRTCTEREKKKQNDRDRIAKSM